LINGINGVKTPPKSPIRGDTAGVGGRGYVMPPDGEALLGGLWGIVMGYDTLSYNLLT